MVKILWYLVLYLTLEILNPNNIFFLFKNEGLSVKLIAVSGSARGREIDSVEQIVTIVTSIIYQCSVAHGTAKYQIYDEYAFLPNYPLKMHGAPPNDKVRNLLLVTFLQNSICNVS